MSPRRRTTTAPNPLRRPVTCVRSRLVVIGLAPTRPADPISGRGRTEAPAVPMTGRKPQPAVHAGYTPTGGQGSAAGAGGHHGMRGTPRLPTEWVLNRQHYGRWTEFKFPHPAAASPSGLLPTRQSSPRTGLTL